MNVNIFSFLLDFITTLGNTAQLLWEWLFDEVTIGVYTFRPILAVGGGLLITFLVLKLVKEFIPLT